MIGPSAVFGRVAIEQMSAGAFHTAEGGRMEQADSGLARVLEATDLSILFGKFG